MLRTKIAPLFLLPLLLGGCSSTITNLTPKSAPRSATGLYSLEARWDCNQQSLRKESITPSVIIGTEVFPMQQTPLTVNRWETVVPVAADQRFLTYRFKFDYLYNSIPKPRPDSRLSTTYQLEILDK